MCDKLIPFSLALLLCILAPAYAGVQDVVAPPPMPPTAQAVVAPQALCPTGYCQQTITRVLPLSGPVEEIEREGLFKRFKARREILQATKDLRRGNTDAIFLRASREVQSVAPRQQVVIAPQLRAVVVMEPTPLLIEEGATGKN